VEERRWLGVAPRAERSWVSMLYEKVVDPLEEHRSVYCMIAQENTMPARRMMILHFAPDDDWKNGLFVCTTDCWIGV
jgi:hypothetical protein